MEVDVDINVTSNSATKISQNKENTYVKREHFIKEMIGLLVENGEVIFKSQQRDENNLSKEEKESVAMSVFTKNKVTFVNRFGKFLKLEHLEYLRELAEEEHDDETALFIDDFCKKRNKAHICVRNRRYEALKRLVEENDYFSEVTMMKRNPLLYEQLVGQYLTEDEKLKRDKIEAGKNNTLVNILMETVERDRAETKRKAQENEEDEIARKKMGVLYVEPLQQPTTSQWGEIKTKPKRRNNPIPISLREKQLLKDEFVTSMYQNFLNGADADFDYESIDNNDSYDNIEEISQDEEEKYFDSEEPETIIEDEGGGKDESSEDELDIYMSALNQNPTVCELSKTMENL